jgi:hypothetical protein
MGQREFDESGEARGAAGFLGDGLNQTFGG